MQPSNLAFIGGGNMAGSLIGGLISDGWPADLIHVADPQQAQLDKLVQHHIGLNVTTDNHQAVQQAEAVILAVKPQALQAVAIDLRDSIQDKRPLIISIAAGIRQNNINNWLGGNFAIVRCMPNTPALVQTGATALFANAQATEDQKILAETVLRATGVTVWVDEESMLDAVTALSGSGPAYFFLVMEAMQAAAEEMGLKQDMAELLTIQTALGAARLALESEDDTATLRQKVTSKGGTTEAALAVLTDNGKLKNLFAEAMNAARIRASAMADEFSN